MGKGNWGDLKAFGFITLWIVLCSGKPDLIDALTVRVIGDQAVYEKIKGEK